MVTPTGTPIDWTAEDPIKVPGKNWAVGSFVTAKRDAGLDDDAFAFKFRGAFDTKDEAQKWAENLSKLDNSVDIWVMAMNRWLLGPGDPAKAEAEYFPDEKLNSIMNTYKATQDEARAKFAERQRRVAEEGLDKHLLDSERLPPPPEGQTQLNMERLPAAPPSTITLVDDVPDDMPVDE